MFLWTARLGRRSLARCAAAPRRYIAFAIGEPQAQRLAIRHTRRRPHQRAIGPRHQREATRQHTLI